MAICINESTHLVPCTVDVTSYLAEARWTIYGLGRWNTVEREAQVRGSDPEVLERLKGECLNK